MWCFVEFLSPFVFGPYLFCFFRHRSPTFCPLFFFFSHPRETWWCRACCGMLYFSDSPSPIDRYPPALAPFVSHHFRSLKFILFTSYQIAPTYSLLKVVIALFLWSSLKIGYYPFSPVGSTPCWDLSAFLCRLLVAFI